MTNREKYKTSHERADAFIKNYWSMTNAGTVMQMLVAFSIWLDKEVPENK